jgi:hypothetical protein
MLSELDDIYNPTLRERLERSIVDKIIGTKMRFGMGLNESVKKSSKKVTSLQMHELAEELHKPVRKKFKNLIMVSSIFSLLLAFSPNMVGWCR